MNDVGVREWLESRVPPPPSGLASILASTVGEARCAAADVPSFLVREAGLLIARLGNGRESANDLLAADALITYGLEAAAERAVNLEQTARDAMTSIAAFAAVAAVAASADRDGEAG